MLGFVTQDLLNQGTATGARASHRPFHVGGTDRGGHERGRSNADASSQLPPRSRTPAVFASSWTGLNQHDLCLTSSVSGSNSTYGILTWLNPWEGTIHMFVAWMEAILNTPMADNVFCRWNLSKVYVMNQQVLIYQGDGEPFLVGVCVFVGFSQSWGGHLFLHSHSRKRCGCDHVNMKMCACGTFFTFSLQSLWWQVCGFNVVTGKDDCGLMFLLRKKLFRAV